MSIRALTLGAEHRLRSEAVFNDRPTAAEGAFVGVQPAPGRPPAQWGQWYAAVWFGGARGNDRLPERSDQLMNLTITLSFRMGYAPRDRQGKEFAKEVGTGAAALYAVADRVIDAIHGRWEVLLAANALIPGTAAYVAVHGGTASVNGFCEPMVLVDAPSERPAPPDWAGADGRDIYLMDIRFKDARRVRRIY